MLQAGDGALVRMGGAVADGVVYLGGGAEGDGDHGHDSWRSGVIVAELRV